MMDVVLFSELLYEVFQIFYVIFNILQNASLNSEHITALNLKLLIQFKTNGGKLIKIKNIKKNVSC